MLLLLRSGAAQQQYTVTASAGSLAVSGTSAAVKIGRKTTVVAGSYSLVGSAASTKAARKLPASTSSYVFTGQATSLGKGQTLIADSGISTLTSGHAYMGAERLMVVVAGQAAVDSSEASLLASTLLATEGTSYALHNNQVYMGVTQAPRAAFNRRIARPRRKLRRYSDVEELATPEAVVVAPAVEMREPAKAVVLHLPARDRAPKALLRLSEQERLLTEIRALIRTAQNTEDESLLIALAEAA